MHVYTIENVFNRKKLHKVIAISNYTCICIIFFKNISLL